MKKIIPSDGQLPDVGRRFLFKAAGLAAAGVAMGVGHVSAYAEADKETVAFHRADSKVYAFFYAEEAVFIRAATARLIPGDEQSPGALQAEITHFIDRALAGAWGAGADMYISGPWQAGLPQQGYQLKFTPSELYRTALGAILRQLEAANTPFEAMTDSEKDAYLTRLEHGAYDLDGVPSDIFFSMLLNNTIEGYLSDPVYGGNHAMVGWKAIGFPGAYASWYDLADKHGIDLSDRARSPLGITDAPAHAGSHNRED